MMRKTKPLRIGDRIRIKRGLLMSGWGGTATVTHDQIDPDGSVRFCKDGADPSNEYHGHGEAMRYQVTVVRKKKDAQ